MMDGSDAIPASIYQHKISRNNSQTNKNNPNNVGTRPTHQKALSSNVNQ